MSDADRLVALYILDAWRGDHPDHADCPSLRVVNAETHFALFYDTGVEGVQFTAELACEHRGQFDYEFGELGDLSYILEDIARDYDDLPGPD